MAGFNGQKIHIKDQMIKELSSFNFSLPGPDIALFLFVKSSNNYRCCLNIIALHKIYIQAYSKSEMDFNAFLSNTLNETILIDTEILKKKGAFEFRIDQKVMHDYDNSSLSKFESKYCDVENKKRFAVKRQYKKNVKELYSIMYYFFINNYKALADDYVGEYVLVK